MGYARRLTDRLCYKVNRWVVLEDKQIGYAIR